MSESDRLTKPEMAFIRRFCFEVWHQIKGPDTIRERYEGCYWDLADLATVSGIQYEVIRAAELAGNQEAPPPTVPFPWDSLDALHDRAQVIRQFTARD